MKISVILPVGKGNTQWLDRAIESTRGFADELIIAADAQAQFHPALALNPLISEILVVESPGVTKAINAAIAISSGDWISLLCSDDYYDERVIELRHRAENTSATVIGSKTNSFGIIKGTWPNSDKISEIATINNIHASALFLKELWWEIHGYKDVRYSDWYFWRELYQVELLHYEFQDKVTYHYQAWTGTISARYNYNSNLGFQWGDGPTDK